MPSLFKQQRQAAKGSLPSEAPAPDGGGEGRQPGGLRSEGAGGGGGGQAQAAQGQPQPQQPPAAASHAVPRPQPQQHQSGAGVGGARAGAGVGGVGEDARAKAERYERFIDETLRVKLKALTQQRGEIVKEIGEYEKLAATLKLVQSEGEEVMKASVNVGCDLYMQAVVPDTSKVIVDVGLGFFVEMTVVEAQAFVDSKVALLQRSADLKSAQAAEVSSQIDVVLQGINEILSLAAAPRSQGRSLP